MNSQFRSVWTHSIKLLVDFPECPTDLSEPQYISLMLETGCMVGSTLVTRRNDASADSPLCTLLRVAKPKPEKLTTSPDRVFAQTASTPGPYYFSE